MNIQCESLTTAERDLTNGTCLIGEIEITYMDLCSTFGEPSSHGDGYKTDAEWELKIKTEEKEEVVTIYNWKDGHNYCGEDGNPVHFITDWHVGGHTKETFYMLLDYLKQKGVEHREYKWTFNGI